MKLFKKPESKPKAPELADEEVVTSPVEDEEVVVTIPTPEETPPAPQPEEPSEDETVVEDEASVEESGEEGDEGEGEEEPLPSPEPETVQFTAEEIALVKEILPKLLAIVEGQVEIEIISDDEDEGAPEEVDEESLEGVPEDDLDINFEEPEEPVVEDTGEKVIKKTKTIDFSPFAEDGVPKRKKHTTRDREIKLKPFGSRWTDGK